MAMERNNNWKILLCERIVKRIFAPDSCPISPTKIDDFHSKYCILKESAKNMTSSLEEEEVLGSMKNFPHRLNFGEYTSITGGISNNRGLRVEREGNGRHHRSESV